MKIFAKRKGVRNKAFERIYKKRVMDGFLEKFPSNPYIQYNRLAFALMKMPAV